MNSNQVRQFIRKNLPFIVFLILAFAVRWSFLDQYVVPSGSMEPTIQVGDHILVNKMAYDLRLPYTGVVLAHDSDPKRGDIVVFENPRDSVTMVKRLIGLPGDHMTIDDGFVAINGQLIEGDEAGQKLLAAGTDEPVFYPAKIGDKEVTIKRLPFMQRPHHIDLTVPADSYFAMGDNRDNSADSRVWGFIPRDKLKGRAFAIFWSGTFPNFVPHMRFDRTGQTLN